MKDFYKMLETPLDRAVDSAIARENERWLALEAVRLLTATEEEK